MFDVTMTFTVPPGEFNSIGFASVAPAGWVVSVDKTWCTPNANLDNTPDTTTAEYLWYGLYNAGQAFTIVYKVQVPSNATPGTYTLGGGWLEYYLGSAGPYAVDITGFTEVTVIKD